MKQRRTFTLVVAIVGMEREEEKVVGLIIVYSQWMFWLRFQVRIRLREVLVLGTKHATTAPERKL